MVMAAAGATILTVLIVARLMRRYGPWLLIPAGFFISSLLHFIEYRFLENAPGTWSVFIYLHTVAIGSILLSGFWSLMAEIFDPRTAKKVFSKITSIATIGGFAGIVLAERIAVLFTSRDVLLLLGTFHLLCSMVLTICSKVGRPSVQKANESEKVSPIQLMKRAPYLGTIALLVVVGACWAALLDYLFKSGAVASIGKGTQMFRFFALFYLVTQIIGFFAQTFVAPRALQRLGIGRTMAMVPIGVGAGALGGMMIPGFPTFAIVRSGESILDGSMFRSAYEILYTPISPAEKRSAKTLIDVGCDRVGDALGGGIVQSLLWIGSSFMISQMLAIVLAMAAAGVWISLRLDRVYSNLIQKRLLDRAIDFDMSDVHDSTTLSVIAGLIPQPQTTAAMPGSTAVVERNMDETLETMHQLRSGDLRRVLGALQKMNKPPSPLIAAQLVNLLAWDDVSGKVQEVLQRDVRSITGVLVDHLTNQAEVDFGIRRRIPRLLAFSDSPLALHGLLAGLDDERFEVRFRCARALDSLMLKRQDLKVPAEVVFSVVMRELKVAQTVWASRRLLQNNDDDRGAFFDDVIRERADKSLEHVFSLFATVLPREPVKIAFRAFHTEDQNFRGLAMEYLDSVLPADISQRLWNMLESKVAPAKELTVSAEVAIERLLSSHESLANKLNAKYSATS